MSSKKKKVLYFLNDLANGGIETFCINVNKNINRNKYNIDYFLTIGKHEYYKEKVEDLGAKVFNIKEFNIPRYIPNFCRLFYITKNLIKKNNYEVIHIHQCKGIISILLAAKINKVEIICVHSHNAFIPKTKNPIINFKIRIYSYIRKIISNNLNTYNLGCSKDACKYMFGDNCFKNKKTKVIFNGISFNKFNKSKINKDIVINKYKVKEGSINFINIARFDEQKNQLFLIRVFSELIKIRKNSRLTIVGHGSLESEIRNEINMLGIEEYVDILPQDTNIPEILSVMDYFLLPSLYEGLGIVLIEAQAMGVQCFASNYVPEEADIGLCEFLPLEIGVEGWTKSIDEYISENKYGNIDNEKLNKYNIKNVVLELEKIYSNNK